MKRIIRNLVLAIALVTGLTTASAQTVQVVLIQKVPALPATIISYMDNPFRYFNFQFIVTDAGSEGVDIFFDMNLTVDTSPLYVRTQPSVLPLQPIHLYNGVNLMSGEELNTQVLSRTETNFDYSNPINAQQLPEGTYQLCVDFYLWSDRMIPNRPSLTVGPCPTFVICYSGSAPELVSPMTGAQMALNGKMVVSPKKKVDFFWTPVISNCAGRNTRFKYRLKVVKVLDGQNYNDAIRINPTVLSTEVRNINHAVFDTLRDVKVQMEKGALYVAQVQAEQIKTGRGGDDFKIANDGVSQPMPFIWGGDGEIIIPGKPGKPGSPGKPGKTEKDDPNFFPPDGKTEADIDPITGKRIYSYSVDEEEGNEGDDSEGVEGRTQWEGGAEEVSELESTLGEMKKQYIANGFIQDINAAAKLTKTYPEEEKYVPTPKRRYMESDGYYTVPMTDDLEVSFMPTRHKSLKNASYTIELYDYIEDGDLDSITAQEPLFVEEIEELPERYNKMDSHELINRTLDEWGSELEQGNLYYLQLSSYFTLGYWKYEVADTSFYVNDKLAEHTHDTVSREFVEEDLKYSNGVFFQWGDDPETPNFATPQWKAPVNRMNADIYDPANYKLPASVPEVKKVKAFPVAWTPVKDLADGDLVEYEVNVYEVNPGQTLDNAIATNPVLVTRSVINENRINEDDAEFFKVFNPKKTYVMTLSTSVTSGDDNFYHFENGNKALPIVFKIIR